MEWVLFADGEVTGGALAMVGVVAGYFFKWLTDRDKLRHDATLKDQGYQIKTQGDRINIQAERIGELEMKHEKCEEAHKACNEKTKQLEEKLRNSVSALVKRDERDKMELRAEIEQRVKGDSQHGAVKTPEIPPTPG